MVHFFRGGFPLEGNGNWFKKEIRATPCVISKPILFRKIDFIENPRSF